MIKPVSHADTKNKLFSTVAVGVIGAEAVRYAHYRALPDYAKFAMRNAGKTQDRFVKEAFICAKKTKRNFPNAVINMKNVRQRAIDIYPRVESIGNRALNSNKSIGLLAAGIFTAGAALYNFVIKPHHEKI